MSLIGTNDFHSAFTFAGVISLEDNSELIVGYLNKIDKVHLFRAKERIYFVNDFHYLGWRHYALKGVKVYEVPGDHKTMLLHPNAKEFARALQTALDNCG